MINSVTLIGRLGHDPSIRTNGEKSVATMSLVVDTGYGDNKRSDWLNVVAFGKSAGFCEKYLNKGQLVYIQGSIKTGSYKNKEGKDVKTFDIYANDIKPLEWKNEEKTPGGYSGGKKFESAPEGFSDINEDCPF